MTDKLCQLCPKGISSILLTSMSLRACDKCYDKVIERIPKWEEKTTLTQLREGIKKKRVVKELVPIVS